MAVAVGIDAGTSSFEIFALEEGKPVLKRTFSTSEVRKMPEIVLRELREINPDVIAGLSGYGLPVKRFSELSDKDVFLMTLNFDETVMGVRRLIDLIRRSEFGRITWTIPGVIHLPTIPEYRKLNRIDMGTSDKLCSVALAIYQLGKPFNEQNFVLVEAGYGFSAFIAVKNGKIVDGIGGTSGFPSFSSLGSMDGELAYLLGDFPKSMLFSGGIRSLLRDRGINVDRLEDLPEFAVEWICEFIMKGIRAVSVSLDEFNVIVSGRFFDVFRDEFKEFSGIEVVKLKGFGMAKQSAEGAAIIANGLAGGVFKDIVDRLEIRKAKGSVLDYITSDIRKYLRLQNGSSLFIQPFESLTDSVDNPS